jgi:hypothetical protein
MLSVPGIILVNCVMQVMWLLRASPTHKIQAGRSQAGQAVSENCFFLQNSRFFSSCFTFKITNCRHLFSVLRIRISDLGSQTHSFESLMTYFWVKSIIILSVLDTKNFFTCSKIKLFKIL